MLSGIASYIWGNPEAEGEDQATPPANTDSVRLKVMEADDDWELVDKSSRSTSPDRDQGGHSPLRNQDSPMEEAGEGSGLFLPLAGCDPDPETVALLRVLPGCWGGGFGTPDSEPLSECETVSSELSSIAEHVVYPSLEESWLVTPPPCFIVGGNSPQRMGTHPMENLLIEHPSMSVYGLRGRQHSVGVDSEHSESSSDTDRAPLTRRKAAASRRVAHPPHRPRAVAARAGLASPAQAIKSMQKARVRQESHRLSRAQMERSNQLKVRPTKGRQQHQYYLRNSGKNNDRKICY